MPREGFCHSEQKRRVYPVGWESWIPSCLTQRWKIRTLTQVAELKSVGIGKACFLHRKKPKQFKVCAVYSPAWPNWVCTVPQFWFLLVLSNAAY